MAKVTVQAGQTLYALMRQQGVSENRLASAAAEVARANNLDDPNQISEGMELTIPDSFAQSDGPAPALGASAAGNVSGANSVFGVQMNQGPIQDARLVDGELQVTTVSGKVNLGDLNYGDFWKSPDGNAVLFSKTTGGGYENENQTLYKFDGESTSQLLGRSNNVAMFDAVDFVKGSDGQPVALASEADGGLGAGSVWALDLENGEVIGNIPGSLKSIDGDRMQLEVVDPSTGEFAPGTASLSELLSGGSVIRDAKMVDGELMVQTASGSVNLGQLSGGGSMGNFWQDPNGGALVYAKNTGGGYEHEDQTLYVFDGVRSLPLLGEEDNVAIFDQVEFLNRPNGRPTILASESDSGLGDGHVWALDLKARKTLGKVRGSLQGLEGDKIKLRVVDERSGEMHTSAARLSELLGE